MSGHTKMHDNDYEKWLEYNKEELEYIKKCWEWDQYNKKMYEQHIISTNKDLCEIGWYIPGNFNVNSKSIEEFLSYTVEDKAIYIQNFLNNNFDKITNEISEKNPRRKHILDQVWGAHLNGNYALSVPVLLSQADGIFYERIGDHFFSKGKKKVALQQKTKNLPMYVQHFFEKSLIDKGTRNGQQLDFMNRHSILHGSDVNYHTKEYSEKSICFLSSINYFVDPDNIMFEFNDNAILEQLLSQKK